MKTTKSLCKVSPLIVVIYTNTDCLHSTFPVAESSRDGLSCTEKWVRQGINGVEPTITGYKVYKIDSVVSRNWGCDSLSGNRCPPSCASSLTWHPTFINMLARYIVLPIYSLTRICIHHPLGLNPQNDVPLLTLLEIPFYGFHGFVEAGDLNADQADCSTLSCYILQTSFEIRFFFQDSLVFQHAREHTFHHYDDICHPNMSCVRSMTQPSMK